MCPRCVKNMPCNPVDTSFFLNWAGMLQTICCKWLCFVSDSWLDDSAKHKETKIAWYFWTSCLFSSSPLKSSRHSTVIPSKAQNLETIPDKRIPESPEVIWDASFFGVLILALPLIFVFAGRFEWSFLVEGTKIFLKNGIPCIEYLFY